ncbi:hypothetical protein [Nocardioides sp. YIM 152315]|uniref:hypothetical protein n=1 Tax=Nocardioides sp. YIM 152315 TaxID=3031760 RepID=UPI0023DA4429|nr:hypothetical protein [Nocardioides sp. YIM 152315]MDF1602042.1 hypothetical protein [Nocardioides sp. YIM 152315]
MSDDTRGQQGHELEEVLDAEIEQARAGQDPAREDEDEVVRYLTRLRELREVVVDLENEPPLGEM